MLCKINLPKFEFFDSFKGKLSLLGLKLVEIGFSKFKNYTSVKNKIIKNVTRKQIRDIKKYFILVMLLLCTITILITYFEQLYRFKKQIKHQKECILSSLSKDINAYELALNSISELILKSNNFNDSKNISKIFRNIYPSDENIKLTSIRWVSAQTNKIIGIYGEIKGEYEVQSLNEDTIDHLGQVIIDSFPILKSSIDYIPLNFTMRLKNEDKKFIGHLTLPLNFISIIQKSLSNNLEDEYVLKIQSNNAKYVVNKNKVLTNLSMEYYYNFTDGIRLEKFPYDFQIGLNKKQFTNAVIVTSITRCVIIIINSLILLLIYILNEKKKIKKSYHESLVEEVSIIKQENENLALYLGKITMQNDKANKLILAIQRSTKLMNEFELNINKSLVCSIEKIKECNSLIIKNTNIELGKELDLERIAKFIATIHLITTDLTNKIYNRDEQFSELYIIEFIDEVIDLFQPIAILRGIDIKKNIYPKAMSFKTNHTVFKQIIISLIAKSIKFLPEDSKIELSVEKKAKSLIFIIKDNGFGINERFSNDLSQDIKGNLSLGLDNIEIDHEIIKHLVENVLNGEIEVNNIHKKGTSVSLCIPLATKNELDSANTKIINFPRIFKKNLLPV
jgi:hypothetical protein